VKVSEKDAAVVRSRLIPHMPEMAVLLKSTAQPPGSQNLELNLVMAEMDRIAIVLSDDWSPHRLVA
jgi:hypothetical protein